MAAWCWIFSFTVALTVGLRMVKLLPVAGMDFSDEYSLWRAVTRQYQVPIGRVWVQVVPACQVEV